MVGRMIEPTHDPGDSDSAFVGRGRITGPRFSEQGAMHQAGQKRSSDRSKPNSQILLRAMR